MLTIDRAIGDKWLVTSGLVAGDRLIVEGLQKVRPGMSVKVVPFETEAPADNTKSDDTNQRSHHSTDGGK